jgi:hypothetical protein
LGEKAGKAMPTLAEAISDSVKDFPQLCVEKVVWGNPLCIELKKKEKVDELGSFTNDKGQPSIQDNQAVEPHK